MLVPFLDDEDPGTRTKVLSIVAFAFILRAVSLLVVHPSIASDSLIYHKLASSLVKSGVFALDGGITAYRPPGYPFFLAAVYSLPGPDVTAVRIIQALLDAFSCLFVFLLGRRVFSAREGLIAAALLSVYIPYILYSQTLLSETLFTFLLLLMLVTIISGIESKRRLATAGVILGLNTLIKPVMALFPAAILVWDLSTGNSVKSSLKRAFLFVLLIGFITAPWCMRNRTVFDEWTFTTNGGINFWIGNNPRASGAYKVPEDSSIFHIDDEIMRNEHAYREAFDFITSHPVRAAKIIPWKIFFFFSSESAILLDFFGDHHKIDGEGFAERYLSVPIPALLIVNFPYYLLFLLCLPSLILEKRDREACKHRLLITTLLFWIAVHLAFFGSNRFHMPMMSLLSVFSARTCSSLPLLFDSTSRYRIAILFLAFIGIFFLWIGEWVGLLLHL